MMNFNKLIILVIIITLTSCSDAPSDALGQEVDKPITSKPVNKDHVLKGYQDKLQKAKDMEKQILKTAERQKKAIDDAAK